MFYSKLHSVVAHTTGIWPRDYKERKVRELDDKNYKILQRDPGNDGRGSKLLNQMFDDMERYIDLRKVQDEDENDTRFKSSEEIYDEFVNNYKENLEKRVRANPGYYHDHDRDILNKLVDEIFDTEKYPQNQPLPRGRDIFQKIQTEKLKPVTQTHTLDKKFDMFNDSPPMLRSTDPFTSMKPAPDEPSFIDDVIKIK